MNGSNYCTEYIEETLTSDDITTPLVLENLLDIKKAVKFRLPDSGILLDIVDPRNITVEAITEKMPNYIAELKLPYDEVALEFTMQNPNSPDKRSTMIILASNKSGGIEFKLVLRILKNGSNFWLDFRLKGFIEPDFNVSLASALSDSSPINETENNVMLYSSYVIMCLVAALQCSNVIELEQAAPLKLNKSRVKKGKEPFFTYKVLTIDSKERLVKQSVLREEEPKSTKRVHLRRGHIRRLEKKTIWVNPCVVGDKSKGMVSKDYKVI